MRLCNFGLAAAGLLAFGCADSREPDPTRNDGPYNMIAPVESGARNAMIQLQPGEWSEGRIAGRPAILFAADGSEPLLALSCDERGGLIVERRGLAADSRSRMIELSFGASRAAFAAAETGAGTLRAAIPFNHQILAAMRGIDDKLRVAVDGTESLLIPPSRLIPALMTRCSERR